MIDPEIQELRDRSDLDDIRDALMSHENVHSTGLGFKLVDGEKTREPAVFAYVEEKLPEDDLSTDELLPESIKGVAVDVRGVPSGSEPDVGSSTRQESRVRPVASGLNAERSGGGFGTMGPIVEDSDGTIGFLTAHHVATDSNGNLVTMYQPAEDTNQSDNNAVGTPTQAESSSSGDDWAFVPFDDQSWATDKALGMGAISTVEEPSFRDRVIVNSAPQGLVGAELTGIDIQGSDRTDYEYRVDDNQSLSGASGGLAAWYDEEVGEWKAFGMHIAHSTNSDFLKFANSLQETLDSGGFSLYTGGGSVGSTSDSAYFEGNIKGVADDASTVTAQVFNAGGTQATQTVELQNQSDGSVIDSTTVDLGGFGYTEATFSTEGVTDVTLSTGDESWNVSLKRWSGPWSLAATISDYDVDIIGVTADLGENYVAVAPNASYVDIYEYGTWNHLTTLETGTSSLSPSSSQEPTISFSGDGNWLAVAMSNSNGDGEASIFNVSDSNPSNWSYETGVVVGTGSVRGVDFSGDSQFFGAVDSWNDPTAQVFETGTWSHIVTLNTGTYGRSFSFSPDDQYVAVGDSNGNTEIFTVGNLDGTGWNTVTRLEDAGNNVGGIDWDDSMRYLAIGSWDDNCYVYNIGDSNGNNWSLANTFNISGSLYSPKFSRDAQYLAIPVGYTSNDSAPVQIKFTGDFSDVIELTASTFPNESAYFTGSHYLYGSRDGVVRIYNAPVDTFPVPKIETITRS